METLVFQHNGRNTHHEECLYDLSHSNMISGLQVPDKFVISGKKGKAELRVEKKILYKMDRDIAGLWIKPENRADNWKAVGIKRMNLE